MPETLYECNDCQDSLYGQRYILRDNDMYCIKCYETNFSHQCELCQQLIGCTSKVTIRPPENSTSRLANQRQPQISLDKRLFLWHLYAHNQDILIANRRKGAIESLQCRWWWLSFMVCEEKQSGQFSRCLGYYVS